MESRFRFAIDRGGTFTDIFAVLPHGKGVRVMKLLSEDPKRYEDAPTEGMRRIMEETLGRPVTLPLDADLIKDIRMGTTVATNALLERKGTKTALLHNSGFHDVWAIGDQTRPDLFDLKARKPEQLYSKTVAVKERILPHLEGDVSSPSVQSQTTGESFSLLQPLDLDALRKNLKSLKEEGYDSLAVALLHSYAYPAHERLIEEVATKEFGFSHVSLSSSISPMIKIVPRGSTAVLDAYLTPILKHYLSKFSSNFKVPPNTCLPVLFMRSDGGLTSMDSFTGSHAILSGPAGGVVGYAQTSSTREEPIVGFDMGGTSTDVSRYHGAYEHIHGSVVSGVQIQTPQLDVNTVAAGGGSILSFRSGLFLAGPESAGAHPGPTCYRKGGPLTVTDANLILGRVIPKYFPHIFGPKENEPLDIKATRTKFESLTKEINTSLGTKMSIEEAALGFIRVANESMSRPIRALTQAKGYDTSKHVLSCFGGAGGQHACAIARSLGMSRVYVHKYAGILSAYGMALADVVHEEQVPCSREYAPSQFSDVKTLCDNLEASVFENLKARGFDEGRIQTELYLNMRYKGTESALMVRVPNTSSIPEAGTLFLKRYETEFGFLLQDHIILVEDVRIRGIGKTDVYVEKDIQNSSGATIPIHEEILPIYFEGGFLDSKVYLLKKLCPGHELAGPCIIIDDLSTILIEPKCLGTIDQKGNLSIFVERPSTSHLGTQLDSIQLSIFSHRFMSIAEQMGRILQRTSISTNIKERLDFSCALFGPDGGLVSNAPHIPVHLGAMQDTVKYQIQVADFHPGDVILANHPKAGGSHLPDLTVITPVFIPGHAKPVFFTANRGHHADIGGSTPGSMPPHSKFLNEEGAQFMSFKLVENGNFKEKELVEKFEEPGKYPNCTGTRCLSDNISDLKAQIAANQKGISLVQELISYYGLDVVQSYMHYIQSNAELSVRDTLKSLGSKLATTSSKIVELNSEDFMDDGSCIKLSISIHLEDGSAVFDFTGTGHQVWGNINTPKAVCYSAVIYSLRCLVGHDIPLNQGCLKPIQIIIPEGCLLNPSEDAAVVGGNVLTSQRIVDVILSAFQAAANSQGCCNNITFGDESFGYYETVAGGSGAGPDWNGTSGVHVHITNTRLTDPEILEKRYPVYLERFSLARGTGGDGKFKGGDGVLRAIQFRKKLTLSILTERRVYAPKGLCGGCDGSRGVNHLVRGNKTINLGGKCSVPVEPGDIFVMKTPGGGGYGEPEESIEDMVSPKKIRKYSKMGGGSIAQYDAVQNSA